MKTIKEVKARMQPGTRLLCVENSYRPVLNGTERTVVKAGATVVWFVADGMNDGKRFTLDWVAGIKILDADTFQMPLGLPAGPSHHVTLRFLAATGGA